MRLKKHVKLTFQARQHALVHASFEADVLKLIHEQLAHPFATQRLLELKLVAEMSRDRPGSYGTRTSKLPRRRSNRGSPPCRNGTRRIPTTARRQSRLLSVCLCDHSCAGEHQAWVRCRLMGRAVQGVGARGIVREGQRALHASRALRIP